MPSNFLGMYAHNAFTLSIGAMDMKTIEDSVRSVGSSMDGDLDFGQFAQFLNILRIKMIIYEEERGVQENEHGIGQSVASSSSALEAAVNESEEIPGNEDCDEKDDVSISSKLTVDTIAGTTFPKPKDIAANPTPPKVEMKIRCRKCKKLPEQCAMCLSASNGTLK